MTVLDHAEFREIQPGNQVHDLDYDQDRPEYSPIIPGWKLCRALGVAKFESGSQLSAPIRYRPSRYLGMNSTNYPVGDPFELPSGAVIMAMSMGVEAGLQGTAGQAVKIASALTANASLATVPAIVSKVIPAAVGAAIPAFADELSSGRAKQGSTPFTPIATLAADTLFNAYSVSDAAAGNMTAGAGLMAPKDTEKIVAVEIHYLVQDPTFLIVADAKGQSRS